MTIKFKLGCVHLQVHVAHPDRANTRRGMRSGVAENIFAEKTDVESLVYSRYVKHQDIIHRGARKED